MHPILSLRSSHLVGDHCLDFGVTAVAAAGSLCHDHIFPLCPDFVSAPRAQAAREHRWRHIEHLLFECQCIPGLDSSVALALLRCDLFRVCSGSDHAEAVLLAAFPTSRIPVVAATACVAPFLLDPAAAPGRMSPWHMKLRCLGLVAAFLLGVSTAVCTRQPPAAFVLARFPLPAWSSVRARCCSASELCSILPQRTCLRLILFCTRPPLCAGALLPMPAWVWRDVRSVFFLFRCLHQKRSFQRQHGHCWPARLRTSNTCGYVRDCIQRTRLLRWLSRCMLRNRCCIGFTNCCWTWWASCLPS